MAAQVLNIEIGKRITKVCVSEKKGKSYAITDSFIFATPEGAAVDGQIVSEISLGDALQNELKERNIVATQAFFTVASTKIASRDVTLPNAKDDQIKNIIMTNAADYFPIEIEKYTIDSTVLERTEEDCRVLVVAVPTAIVESYIALGDYMGISIGALDYCANSQYQVLRSIGGENVDMFINVDADATSVIFTENGKLLMQRSLAFGGDDIISRYMSLRGLESFDYLKGLAELSAMGTKANADEESNEAETDEADAGEDAEAEESTEENAEENEETEDISSVDIKNDIGFNAALNRLTGNISRSVDYFRNGSYGEKEIGRVVLMGTCCHIAGLAEKIAENLGVEVTFLEEVSDIQTLANSIGDISIYIGCLGSRLAPMNFLPKEYVKKHGRQKGTINGDNFGIVALAAAVLIAVILCGIPGIRVFLANRKLAKVESQITQYEYAEQEYQTYINYTNGNNTLQSFVNGAQSNNTYLRAFFEELEEKMPSDLVLLSASCTADGVSLNVTVPSFKEAAATLRQLRSFASIDVINCSALSQSGDEGTSLVSFSLSCTYVVEEQPTEPVVEETTEETTEE